MNKLHFFIYFILLVTTIWSEAKEYTAIEVKENLILTNEGLISPTDVSHYDEYRYQFLVQNNQGHRAGSFNEETDGVRVLFFWSPNDEFVAIELPRDVSNPIPISINNVDQVLIYTNDGYFLWDAKEGVQFIIKPDEGSDLRSMWPTPEEAMNDHQQFLLTDYVKSTSFIVNADKTKRYPSPSKNFRGLAINNLGDVVGYRTLYGEFYKDTGLLWTHDDIQIEFAVENADVHLVGINDQGEVIGDVKEPPYVIETKGPFVWSENEGTVYLQQFIKNKKWHLEKVLSINEKGQVLVSAYMDLPNEWRETFFLLSPEK